MDENDNNKHNAEETKKQTAGVERKIENDVLSKPVNHDGAGPSGANPLPPLPGAVDKIIQKSKSEHNLRHIITDEDLARALQSISFNPNQDCLKEHFTKRAQNETSFIDIKKFMESCFHLKDQVNNNFMIELPNVPCNDLSRDQVFEPKPAVKSNEQLKAAKQKISGTFSVKSQLIYPKDSMSSIGSNVCRICMTRGKERLISPCNCKGSLANVHLSCLERWLNQVGRNHCELCGYSYPATRTPRYTVLQALRLWFGNPRNRNHLQSDCLIFWLLSTVTAGLLAVCIVGTQYFVVEGNKFSKLGIRTTKEEGISHRITETAMNFFMAIVLCGYSVTVYLLWKDHYVMWNRWRRANVNVRLLLTPDSDPVPFVPRPRYSIV